ncbi:hypothetical protein [Streptomyces sp. NPDC059371]|uniref:hypothetical protein n=1 Tax=Streptomyces sp. NPDC059371 TaxID=3346812 RepID=UPI0036CC4355
MRLISERSGRRRAPKSWLPYGAGAGTVAATALVGARAVDADSSWYRSPRKPP